VYNILLILYTDIRFGSYRLFFILSLCPLLLFKKLLTISDVASLILHKIKPKAKLFFILLLFEDISKAAENSATKAESADEGKENDADEEKEKEIAATKIPAAFRGHHARKSLRVSETASKETDEKYSESTEQPTQEQLQEEFSTDDQGERLYIL